MKKISKKRVESLSAWEKKKKEKLKQEKVRKEMNKYNKNNIHHNKKLSSEMMPSVLDRFYTKGIKKRDKI